VALFETEPIEADTFLLHGTVPIPPGVYPRKDGQSPFHVLDGPGGAPVPAQVAVVSRRPNGEADVLEVMARVHGRRARAPLTKETPDARRPRFVLVLSPAPTLPAPEVPASVAELLAPRGRQPLRLRARDVFGHLYEVNLRGSELDAGFGSRSVLKSGRWVRQTRTYGTMVCEKPARPKNRYATLPPPLPHLFGVHAYITEYAGEERVSIDLRIHNGHSAGSRKPHIFEAPLGLVYFDSLELILPAGWTAVPRVRDPFFGEPRREKDSMVVPIVAPLQARAEGEAPPLHMIGPRGQFHRRLEIVPLAEGSSPAKAILEARGSLGLAFPVPRNDLWSWQNPSTARFGPQRTILAGWDFYRRDGTRGPAGARAADGNALSVLAGLLREGNAGADSVAGEVMGWAHPWFGKYQGVTGGFAVDTIGGARVAGTASQDGYRRLELLHRMNTCRQPQALYDWRGEPVGFHQWVTPKGRVSLRYRSNVLGSPPSQRLPCRRGPQASVQAQTAILTDRRPAYDLGTASRTDGKIHDDPRNLLAWMPHDGQHLARYTKFAQALAWLGNDALAKDDLILCAELYRLMVHDGLSPQPAADVKVPKPVDGAQEGDEEEPPTAREGLKRVPPAARELAAKAQKEREMREAKRAERLAARPVPPPLALHELESLAAERRHGGAQVGRELAWGLDAMCAAYSLADPAWRRRATPWFQRMAAVLPRLATPAGIIQRQVSGKFFSSKEHAGAQSFEALLLVHGLRCLDASVFEEVAPNRSKLLRELALRAIDYLFFGPPWQQAKSGGQRGPARAFAVAPADARRDPYAAGEGGTDREFPPDGVAPQVEVLYGWEALAWAASLTDPDQGPGPRNRFLVRALAYGKGADDLQALEAALARRAGAPSRDDSGNWAGFLGYLQALVKR
jgi:hypothetical protein